MNACGKLEQKEDDFSLMFWKQNIAQFWTEEEIAVSSDKNTWAQLSKEEQIAYKRVLGGFNTFRYETRWRRDATCTRSS